MPSFYLLSWPSRSCSKSFSARISLSRLFFSSSFFMVTASLYSRLSLSLLGVYTRWTYGIFSLFSQTGLLPLSGRSLNYCDMIINYREQQLNFITLPIACAIYNKDIIISYILHRVGRTRMDQLIHCSSCEAIPYDVLMMNCNHNLCIKCAVARMQAHHHAKSVAGRLFLQCQKCKSRTNLDEESVNQLERAQKTKGYIQKIYFDHQGDKRVQTPINTGRTKNLAKKQEEQHKNQAKGQQFNKNNGTLKKQSNQIKNERAKIQSKQGFANNEKHMTASKVEQKPSKNQLNYGQCQVHKEEPVMYYCFTCKIHCFCAECILVGKHNQHDVKVIKKAFLVVEKQFEDAVSRIKKFVNELVQSNKIAANNINASKNKADSVKKAIEKAFDEVRATLRQKEVQFMKIVDKKFTELMETNNGIVKKTLETKLRDQQQLLGKLQNNIKKGERNCLNFYADEWENVKNSLKNQEIKVPVTESSFNQILTDYISELKKQIEKVEMKKLKT